MPIARGSLTIVGTGITAIGQITLEAQAHIAQAGKVLYLVADPLTIDWIRELNCTAEDLYPLYQPGRDRLTTYFLMTDRMLNCVREGVEVCAIFYGHPGVFVFPSHEALIRARREGYEAQMLPAISAEDCLFADLGIDPGRAGCQSYEATDFLVHRRLIDTTCSVILWQIGVVGQIYNQAPRPESISILVDTLIEKYGSTHEVIIYEAKQYPTCDPVITRLQLGTLAPINVSPVSTLYIPPLKRPMVDVEVARRLGIPDSFITRMRETPSLYDPLEPRRT